MDGDDDVGAIKLPSVFWSFRGCSLPDATRTYHHLEAGVDGTRVNVARGVNLPANLPCGTFVKTTTKLARLQQAAAASESYIPNTGVSKVDTLNLGHLENRDHEVGTAFLKVSKACGRGRYRIS